VAVAATAAVMVVMMMTTIPAMARTRLGRTIRARTVTRLLVRMTRVAATTRTRTRVRIQIHTAIVGHIRDHIATVIRIRVLEAI